MITEATLTQLSLEELHRQYDQTPQAVIDFEQKISEAWLHEHPQETLKLLCLKEKVTAEDKLIQAIARTSKFDEQTLPSVIQDLATHNHQQTLAIFLGTYTPTGNTPLHNLCLLDEKTAIQLLSHIPDDMLATENQQGENPVALAVKMGYEKLAEELLKRGAPPCPLHEAVRAENLNLVKLLMKHGASYKEQDQDGETPLLAALNHHTPPKDIVNFLLEQPNPPIEISDNQGNLPLHYALQNSLSLGSLLIDQSPQGLNRRNHKGTTPLFFAAERTDLSNAAKLIDRGAEIDWDQLTQALSNHQKGDKPWIALAKKSSTFKALLPNHKKDLWERIQGRL